MSDHALSAPTLLIAMPQVQDPFFHQAVVFLCSHDDDGSLGFVINNPTDLAVAKVLEGFEIPWGGDADQPTLLGGPVDPQTGTILLPTGAVTNFDEESTHEITPGVSITRDIDMLRRVAKEPPAGLRFLLGYAGWSPGQLDQEIARHDWLMSPVDPELLLLGDVMTLWETALAQLGLEQGELPGWSNTSEAVN